MARPYRWLGGIGYILGLIPYIGLISPILVAVAWILMGRDTRERIFTILGILMIVTCSLAIAVAAWLIFLLIWPPAPWGMGGAHGIPAQLLGIVIVILLLAGLATASFILDIMAHFRAGRIFNSRWFRAAGWARIILAAALIAAIAFMALTIIPAVPRPLPAIPPPLEAPYAAFALFLALFWPLAIALLIDLLAIIFSIVAFFTIPGEATPAPS
jgi:hypothetical protein